MKISAVKYIVIQIVDHRVIVHRVQFIQHIFFSLAYSIVDGAPAPGSRIARNNIPALYHRNFLFQAPGMV